MYQNKFDMRSLRSALLLGAASAAALGLSAPALAQSQQTETVVVTGSRIPQQGLFSPSPVTAVGQQEFKFEGTVSVDSLLNNLPSVFADQTQGVSNGASGTATVNLRGIGPSRTLVLVNGTRLMPGDPRDPVPDLNEIPAALVDHVEVLTGGASAVYGSDALAGVVNFVMRKDFEGVELDAQYGAAEADNSNGHYRALLAAAGDAEPKENILDGANVTGTLLLGTNTANGKGNVTAYLTYQNNESVLARARDFSACTISFSTTSGPFCGGSSNFNRWVSVDNKRKKRTDPITGKPFGAPVGPPNNFFEEGTGAPGSGFFVPFRPNSSTLFNYGAVNYLQRPDTRYSGGFFAHYEVNKELDVYSSFLFTDDHTLAQIAPSAIFRGAGTIKSNQQVNCSNPLLTGQERHELCGLITPGQAFDDGTYFSVFGAAGPNGNGYDTGDNGAGNIVPGQATLQIGRRNVEGGNRFDDLRHTSYRFQVGARGDLGDGWTYEVYAQYGTSILSENYQNELSKKRVQNALEVDPATGKCFSAEPDANGIITDTSCVPLDIFNGIGSITPAQLKYVGASGFQEGYTEEQIISGSLTGDLGSWGGQSPWAKSPIGVSVGSEYRSEYLKNLTDEEFALGTPAVTDLYGQGGATVSTPRSGFNVVEGFGELKVPLVQDKTFVEDLSFDAGYRYSSYSSVGSVSAYKYGAEWQPIDDIRVRASYERAVRAPNVLESFAPANIVLFGGQDPCETLTPVTAVTCAGIPNAFTGSSGLLNCPANQCNQGVGGNLNLKPEIGDTRSIGVVFTPTFLEGFTATVDYFNIDVSNAINTISPTVTVAQCYTSGNAAAASFFCPFVHRNAQGQIFGDGFVSATTLNTGFIHTKGIDVEANYNVSLDDLPWTQGYGALQFGLVGTYLQSDATEPLAASGKFPGTGSYDCAGLYGITCGTPNPRWRHRLRVTWQSPWDFDFSVNWRYLSGVSNDQNSSNPLLGVPGTNAFDQTINAYWYLDLAGDWNVRPGVNLRAGMNNVFDRLPPVISSFALPGVQGNDNTFPGTYDALGRTFFIGATIKY